MLRTVGKLLKERAVQCGGLHGLSSRGMSIYDPPYLDQLKPEIDLCEPFNIQITGPDYALVESYQKVVHRIARTMGVDVSDGWAVPAKKTKIVRFKPASCLPETEYSLNHFQRNIQVVELPNNLAPLLCELVQAALPQSVSINIRPHTDEDEIEKYVPDMELKQLKTELDSAGGPVVKRTR